MDLSSTTQQGTTLPESKIVLNTYEIQIFKLPRTRREPQRNNNGENLQGFEGVRPRPLMAMTTCLHLERQLTQPLRLALKILLAEIKTRKLSGYYIRLKIKLIYINIFFKLRL
jgi:hypothetical protein